MQLFTYFRSSAAYRVRIALNYKAVAYESIAVNLLQRAHQGDEYREINAQGLVPTLRLDDGRVLTQSPAILEWLDACYPQPPLLPEDTYQQAVVRSWANLIGCDIHPLNNLRVLNYLTKELGISDDQKQHWYHHWIQLGFTALEQEIDAQPYCLGAQITMADLYLVPQVYNALRFGVDMTPFSKIHSVYEACNQLQPFRRAAPENQPDNPQQAE